MEVVSESNTGADPPSDETNDHTEDGPVQDERHSNSQSNPTSGDRTSQKNVQEPQNQVPSTLGGFRGLAETAAMNNNDIKAVF